MVKGKKRRDTPVVLTNILSQQQSAGNRREFGIQQGTNEESSSHELIDTKGKGKTRRDTPVVLASIPSQQQYSVDRTHITPQNAGKRREFDIPRGTVEESSSHELIDTKGKGKRRRDTPVVLPSQPQSLVNRTKNAGNRRASGGLQGTNEGSSSQESIDFLSANIERFAQPFAPGQRKKTLAKPNL